MSGKVFALILAAGSSQRFGEDKLSQEIDGNPVWLRSFIAFENCPGVDGVGVVTSAEKVSEYSRLVPSAEFVLEGGSSRTESCQKGVLAIPDEYKYVLVHDGARPFVSEELIIRVIAEVKESGVALPVVPVTDTIRDSSGRGLQLLDRSHLHAAQTPQGARREYFLKAFAESDGKEFTDDIALLESAGYSANLVDGDSRNKKITFQEDIKKMKEIRTGLGYDIHSFSTDPNRPLWLGGVEFDDKPGLDGHSDADALLHAVVDSLLGAAGLGDIGVHYPNTDPEFKNCPSVRFLQESSVLLKQNGWKIINIDATVVAERPKVMTKSDEIKKVISDAVGLDVSRVNIKATTNEKLGAIGRSEGVAAFATSTIQKA